LAFQPLVLIAKLFEFSAGRHRFADLRRKDSMELI
jgi:hypothetical protein